MRIEKRFNYSGSALVDEIEIDFDDGGSAVCELKRDSMMVVEQQ